MKTYTPTEAYEAFVGSITPEEFIKPYVSSPNPLESAIAEIESNWVWETPKPTELAQLLREYVESHLD